MSDEEELAKIKADLRAIRQMIFTNTDRAMVIRNRFFRAVDDGIYDENFDYDATLKISGDFCEGEKSKYATMIASTLNCYQAIEKDNESMSNAIDFAARLGSDAAKFLLAWKAKDRSACKAFGFELPEPQPTL